ncbi:MAG: hypothetical protein HQ582_22350 [Planctomycetes bacterium]|nr:hypothetical protein [Planctomycetota bacterium]
MARCFEAFPHGVMFVGHYHRWQIAETGGSNNGLVLSGFQYGMMAHVGIRNRRKGG